MKYIIVAKPLTQPPETITESNDAKRNNGSLYRREGRSIVRPRLTGKSVFLKKRIANCKLVIAIKIVSPHQ
jgi:hypothetical protein